ncbi:MAG: HAMP domain-containing histidine kinase [Nitrospinae bacterium]|nr:HAMP domain-containing histidine kinase [Nitrospinota bacterium]
MGDSGVLPAGDGAGHNRHVHGDKANWDEYSSLRQDFHDYFSAAYSVDKSLIQEGLFSPAIQKNVEKVGILLPKLHGRIDRAINTKYALFERMISVSKKEAAGIIIEQTLFLVTLALAGFVLVFAVIRSIIKPITSLVAATKELGAGKLDVRINVKSADEIGDLGVSFNAMADRLKEDRDSLRDLLEEREKMQKVILKTNKNLKEANSLLQQADVAKTNFLASMSHELRTPLNAMINFTALVIEDWDDLKTDEKWFAKAKDMLERVKSSSYHLLDMINDILDLAKIESGKMTLDLQEADLAEIAGDCAASLESLAKKKDLRLILNVEKTPNPIICDRRKVKQIVLNLLGNAIKFTDSGQITVSVRREGADERWYALEVADTGIGIDPKHQQIIFNRFEQVDNSDTRLHAGTGLGLNLVKELTEMHGGKVAVESEPGKGSVFTVHLPDRAIPPVHAI